MQERKMLIPTVDSFKTGFLQTIKWANHHAINEARHTQRTFLHRLQVMKKDSDTLHRVMD
jgi:hypothetical protein